MKPVTVESFRNILDAETMKMVEEELALREAAEALERNMQRKQRLKRASAGGWDDN
jgi:hypothetical protein